MGGANSYQGRFISSCALVDFIVINHILFLQDVPMFTSNIQQVMDKKNKTIMQLSKETGLSSQTIFRATQDDTIGGCQLNTLSKIGGALGVKTKRLYEEVNDDERGL